jgi:hypothetical protein
LLLFYQFYMHRKAAFLSLVAGFFWNSIGLCGGLLNVELEFGSELVF